MGTAYDDDVAAWALEQVALLKAGHWTLLDVEHIAEEIEDMNLSNRHQIAHRMSILLAHLLKWRFQPDHRGASWESTIHTQRERIGRQIGKMPSLRRLMDDPEWDRDVWRDAVDIAGQEANIGNLPKSRIWTYAQALDDSFFPD